jgi:uncharacterized protein YqfB (UPF0267 family)
LNSNNVSYSSDIEKQIISNLDGWRIQDDTDSSENTNESLDVNPFMTTDEFNHKANKVITRTECQLFYEETLDNAYMHTNRLNIDDLTSVEANIFIRAVCKWTASNLWNKYNIRVNNEDLEDTYVQSYGGLLYSSAMKALQPFINQRISNLINTTKNNNDDDKDIWIV